MKLSDVVGQRPVLEKIAAKEMDAASAIKFAKFARSVMMELQKFEEKRAELFRKYGEEVEENDKKVFKIKAENETKFNNAIKRALGKKLTIQPFPLTAMDINITPADLVNSLALFK